MPLCFYSKGVAPFLRKIPVAESHSSSFQVLHGKPTAHILVCSPSNSACDLVVQRLLETKKVDRQTVLRLYARSRLLKNIPYNLKVKHSLIF